MHVDLWQCIFFKFLTVADLCHKFTQNLVDKKQVIYIYLSMNMICMLKYKYIQWFNRAASLIPKENMFVYFDAQTGNKYYPCIFIGFCYEILDWLWAEILELLWFDISANERDHNFGKSH